MLTVPSAAPPTPKLWFWCAYTLLRSYTTGTLKSYYNVVLRLYVFSNCLFSLCILAIMDRCKSLVLGCARCTRLGVHPCVLHSKKLCFPDGKWAPTSSSVCWENFLNLTSPEPNEPTKKWWSGFQKYLKERCKVVTKVIILLNSLLSLFFKLRIN